MEAFRYGFNFNIQKKAVAITSNLLGIKPVKRSFQPRRHFRPHRRFQPRRRFQPHRHIETPQPAPLIKMKMYLPPTFSLEIDNMFEVLDL